MTKNMTRNWKTSLAGILGGILILLGPSVDARLGGDTLGNVAIGAAIAALGLTAKDGDVTGGTRRQ